MAPKLKLPLWKILHEALPVGELLVARQILPSAKCIRCECPESILHLFYHCPYAQKVWKLAPYAGDLDALQVPSFEMGWRRALNAAVLPPIVLSDCHLAPWIIASIWSARNLLVFQKREFTAQETITKAICDAKEWKEAQPISTPRCKKPQTPRPPRTEVICRSDAAWKKELKAAGLAWTFSDVRNERFSSHSVTCALVISSLVAEGLAMRSAMEQAIDLQLRKVTFESDSLQLVSAIEGSSYFSEIHGILSDIHLLSSYFDEISFRFCHRENLVIEDGLAKQALRGFVPNPV